MTAPSNANASGLEVVAWRIEDLILPQTTFTTDEAYAHHRDVYRYEGEVTATVEPLVTAASAQARIDAAEARADRLAKALERIAEHLCAVEPHKAPSAVQWAEKEARAALQQETQP